MAVYVFVKVESVYPGSEPKRDFKYIDHPKSSNSFVIIQLLVKASRRKHYCNMKEVSVT